MEYKDYYKILGVSRDAKADQIKAAYRKLARKYHPDVSKEPNAEERFKEVNEANEVLKDSEKRAQYDALGSGWHAGDNFRPPPGAGARGAAGRGYEFSEEEAAQFSDFFSSIFGGMGGGRGGRSSGFGNAGMNADPFAARGRDQTARIRISLEEAYQGGTRQLRLEVPEIDAQGQVKTRIRTLNVRIPAGVTEGQQIRLAGQGSAGGGSASQSSSAGDLFLEVELEPHAVFRSEGKDIHLKLPIAPWEAARGATVPVPTLGGTVSLKIPAGSQSGQRLRLKGRGLPGKPAGDAFVQLEISNPPADSDEARAAFDALAEHFKSFNPRAKLGV
ncbi:cytochrome C biogenesis protein [Lamprobacter modestohalophilus]|uniref:Cytochrome C biogenesis protein n=1 Tax=Lamprobacter modestohalophilus TaxID=1064514 RepID=A0A9X0WBJ3_9GAMM|nr:DnaJ C-terminal domain-containing protein [Lamprobacter modestohalophilus]MBK1620404.1 cytochrome C biogenesis protein [Lamprobacter modestohalophilus]